jgi:hypothetical protein
MSGKRTLGSLPSRLYAEEHLMPPEAGHVPESASEPIARPGRSLAAAFAEQLSRSPETVNPVEDLCGTARLWADAQLEAAGLAARFSATEHAESVETLHDVVRSHYQAAFDRASARLTVLAKSAGVLDEVLQRVDDLGSALKHCGRSLTLGVMGIIRARARGYTGNPVMDTREELSAAIQSLERLKPLLCPVDNRPPLPEPCQMVYVMLEGNILKAKDIAVQIGLEPSDEDVVRKRIDRIRKTGREISNRRGVGYFRPDAPPPQWGTVSG